jgi:phage gp37-like protein
VMLAAGPYSRAFRRYAGDCLRRIGTYNDEWRDEGLRQTIEELREYYHCDKNEE